MGLDWFTLIAQIVNFLVLVWLLKHLFYGRVIRAMNEREARIAGRLEEAARTRASAEQEAELFRTRNRELEEQRDGMLARARHLRGWIKASERRGPSRATSRAGSAPPGILDKEEPRTLFGRNGCATSPA